MRERDRGHDLLVCRHHGILVKLDRRDRGGEGGRCESELLLLQSHVRGGESLAIEGDRVLRAHWPVGLRLKPQRLVIVPGPLALDRGSHRDVGLCGREGLADPVERGDGRFEADDERIGLAGRFARIAGH